MLGATSWHPKRQIGKKPNGHQKAAKNSSVGSVHVSIRREESERGKNRKKKPGGSVWRVDELAKGLGGCNGGTQEWGESSSREEGVETWEPRKG